MTIWKTATSLFGEFPCGRYAAVRLLSHHAGQQERAEHGGQMSTILADAGLNIEDMLNKSRGELAYTIVDLDARGAGFCDRADSSD